MGYVNDTPRWSYPAWAAAYAERHFAGADDHAEERHNAAANPWRSAFREDVTPGVYRAKQGKLRIVVVSLSAEDYRVIETRTERMLV